MLRVGYDRLGMELPPGPSSSRPPTVSTIPTARRRRGIGENLWMGTHELIRSKRWSAAGRRKSGCSCPACSPTNSRTGNWMAVGHYSAVDLADAPRGSAARSPRTVAPITWSAVIRRPAISTAAGSGRAGPSAADQGTRRVPRSIVAVSGVMLVEVALDDPQVAACSSGRRSRGWRRRTRDQAEQEIDPDIAGHARHLPFRHAEVARFPHHVAAERGAGDVADHRDEVEDHVEPDLLLDARG